MNLFSWQKIKKISFNFCTDETFCLQFFLENDAVRGFYIQNGEYNKGLYVGKEKLTITDFFDYPSRLIRTYVTSN